MVLAEDDVELKSLLADHDVEEIGATESSDQSLQKDEPEDPDFDEILLSKTKKSGRFANSLKWLRTMLAKIRSIITWKSLLTALLALAPSFLQPSFEYESKLYPTSWLDGLRGFAAFSVFVGHFIVPWWPSILYGYASGPDHYNPVQLPFIRTIYAGNGMVSVFFIVSGYALSYGSIKKNRRGDSAAVFDTLASSVFRRWLRLFLPLAVSTFISLLITRGDWWIKMGPLGGPAHLDTFYLQVKYWWLHFLIMSNPTGSGRSNPYGPQLWTIPRELKGSLVVYLVVLGLAKVRDGIRFALLAFLCWYMLWNTQWDLFLFLYGVLLAELQLFSDEFFKENETFAEDHLPKVIHRHSKAIMHVFSITLMLVALHLINFPPIDPGHSPGYEFLIGLTPNDYMIGGLLHRYWKSIGAAWLLTAISLSPRTKSSGQPLLQLPFRTRFIQYLGYISFGLYVTHYYALFTIGSRIYLLVEAGSPTKKIGGFVVAIVVNTFLCFWVADIFWRGVDTRAISISKYIAKKCFR